MSKVSRILEKKFKGTCVSFFKACCCQILLLKKLFIIIKLYVFQLQVPYNLREYIQLNISHLINLSPSSQQPQFDILSVSTLKDDNGTKLKFKIELQRMPMYHLTNTYIPTLSLIIIVELTLFFDESQLQSALSLSLTIMLVMYTLYQSVQTDLTETAYMTFIDYWLTFSLIVPFAIFLVEICWEFDRVKKEKTAEASKSEVIRLTKKDRKVISCIPKHSHVQCIVVTLTIGFIFVYSAIAVYFYNFP